MQKFLFRKSRKCIQKSSKKKFLHLLLTLTNYLICKNKNLKRMYKNDKMVVRNR